MTEAAGASRVGVGRLLWLSVAAAVTTIALKTLAWQLTDSLSLADAELERAELLA